MFALISLLFISFIASYSSLANAASATEINIKAAETLKRFRTEISGGNAFFKTS